MFFNYLTICSQIPNLLLNILNLFVVLSGGLHKRIYVSLAIIASVCIITIGLVFIDSSNCNFHLFFTQLFNYFRAIWLFCPHNGHRHCAQQCQRHLSEQHLGAGCRFSWPIHQCHCARQQFVWHFDGRYLHFHTSRFANFPIRLIIFFIFRQSRNHD